MSQNNPNPFDILKLPVSFDVDEKRLHKQMIKLAAANHPDRFEDALDQADAAERSAAINQAYRLLKDPQSRAQVLLSLLGDDGKRDEKKLPPNLLMEMMEIREEIEDAIASKDKATLSRLSNWAKEQKVDYLQTLGEQLAQAQALSQQDNQSRQTLVQHAQVSLNCLRYMNRMLEQMPAEHD